METTHNAKLIRKVELLVGESERCVPSSDALHWRLQPQEAALLDLGGQLTSDSSSLDGLVHNNASSSLVHRLDHSLNLSRVRGQLSVRRGGFPEQSGSVDERRMQRSKIQQLTSYGAIVRRSISSTLRFRTSSGMRALMSSVGFLRRWRAPSMVYSGGP